MHSTKSFATSSAVAVSSTRLKARNAAKSGHGIARQRVHVSFACGLVLGRAARIVVLDDRNSRALEFADESPGRIEVYEVVIGTLLALELLRARESRRRAACRNVERRGLVGIFAIAHRLAAFEIDVDSLR